MSNNNQAARHDENDSQELEQTDGIATDVPESESKREEAPEPGVPASTPEPAIQTAYPQGLHLALIVVTICLVLFLCGLVRKPHTTLTSKQLS